MKSFLKIAFVLLMISGNVNAQKYITKNGKITFFSDAAAEKIEAVNNQVSTALDIATGDVVFKVLIKSFEFKNALMQEHFNENYLESDKFPNATYKGKITNLKDINFSKNGKYKANVEGDMTIHGITKKENHPGTIEVKDGKVLINSKFTVAIKDYDIKVPKMVLKNIADNIEVTVDESLEKIK
ncbi:MAG: YceI family protein [Bacteroidota bacterium]